MEGGGPLRWRVSRSGKTVADKLHCGQGRLTGELREWAGGPQSNCRSRFHGGVGGFGAPLPPKGGPERGPPKGAPKQRGPLKHYALKSPDLS